MKHLQPMRKSIFMASVFFGIGFLGLCKAQHLPQSNSFDTLPKDNPEPYQSIDKDVDFRYHKISTESDCQLYVKEAGPRSETAIVFLHGGWGMEHTPLADYFVNHLDLEDHYRLIFYDQRGSMRSRCRDYDNVSVDKHVEDLERIRRTLNIDKLKIVGWSMGTYLAYKYLESYEKHVDGLIGIGPLPIHKYDSLSRKDNVDVKEKMLGRDAYQNVLAENGLKEKDRSEYTEKELYRYNKIALMGMNLYHVNRWRCFVGAYGQHRKARIAGGKTMSSQWNFRSVLENASFRPIFIVGDYDYVSDSYPEYFQSFEETEGLRLYYLRKAGHTAFIDRPETIKTIVEEAWISD